MSAGSGTAVRYATGRTRREARILQRSNRAGRTRGQEADMVEECCIFCRIIGAEEMVSIVYEDDRAIAFLDIQPMSTGHTLVVPKDHYETLFDLPDSLALHCLSVARRIAPGIQAATGADAINVFSPNGQAGGQDVPHFHFHLIPVKEGDHFALQLPAQDAPIPMRSELDITAARIGRAIQSGSRQRVGAL